jgi:hypothetical protein
MERIIFFIAAVAISVSGACASKSGTRQEVEATEENEETAGDEGSLRYRRLEGSSGFSSEEAAKQLAGD